MLKAAGLVTLKGDWTAFSTPAYIDEAKSKVKVTPLKAEQVATTLKDPTIAAGVINNDYVPTPVSTRRTPSTRMTPNPKKLAPTSTCGWPARRT